MPVAELAPITVMGLRRSGPLELVLTCAMQVVLARYTAMREVTVGTARRDCSGNPPFRDFLGQGSTTAHDADRDQVRLVVVDADVVRVTVTCDLFDVSTAQRVMASFLRVLAAVAEDPSTRLSRLPVVAENERRLMVHDWNDTAVELTGAQTVPGLLAQQVARRPDSVALVADAEQVTFRELDERSNALSLQVRARADRGQVVGVCTRRPVGMIIALLAVLKAGAAYLPLDPDYPVDRLAFMIADSGARLVLTGTDVRLPLPRATVPFPITTGEQAPFADPVEYGPGDLALVIYTSGSTGTPKGAGVPHGAITAFASGLRLALREERIWTAGSSTLLASSFSFDVSVRQLMMMCSGVTLHVLDHDSQLDSSVVAQYVRDHRIDSFACTPTRLATLIDEGIFDAAAEHPVHALVGGEAIGTRLWRRLSSLDGVRAYNHYGPTECTCNSTITAVVGSSPVLGRPIANVRCYVLDPDQALVPIGAVGELYIGGAGVCDGYRNRPAMTADRFVPDPFGPPGNRLYRSGDLVRYRSDGMLEFIGRTDDQVKIRGYRVELGEIESALVEHAAVEQAAVVARDERGDERLVGYIALAPGSSVPTTESLRTHLHSWLPEYMVPSRYVVVERMPLDPNGKLDRRALPEPPPAESLATALGNPVEAVIAGIWADVLGLPSVGVHDNFFELGGHSLLANRILSRIRREFRVEVGLRVIFEAPTIAELAKRIRPCRGIA